MPGFGHDSSDHDSGVQMTHVATDSGTDPLPPVSDIKPHSVLDCHMVSSSAADIRLERGYYVDCSWSWNITGFLFYCHSMQN